MSEQPSRRLNIAVAPGSETQRRVSRHTHTKHGGGASSPNLAAGFTPDPSWNLADYDGPTIANLTFVNRYLGGSAAWPATDMENIDTAMSKAFSDANLESVIAQYFTTGISTTMLPSAVDEGAVPATVYKDNAEAFARELHDASALGTAAPASSVICMMLPPGTVLSDDFSPGYKPAASEAEAFDRRRRGVIKLDKDDAADSRNGLGGYHGSIHLSDGTEVYYAVGVYSQTEADGSMNGIDAFGVPWKNVVATFYHEVNETRTDAAVEDVNSTGNDKLLGWYSEKGQGEIGDLPINACNGKLDLVFKEVQLSDGSGTVPIQLMWSNADDGPAASTGAAGGAGSAP
jgi:hypothetical protein